MLVGILAALLCMATGVYGYFSDSLEIKNHITMGDIRINMTEFARKGNGEVKYRDPAYIFPGERISKIPRIKNRALPCWIRAVSYTHLLTAFGSYENTQEALRRIKAL